MFQVRILVEEPCRPSSIRKSAALRRRRFQGQILGTIPVALWGSGVPVTLSRLRARVQIPPASPMPLKHKRTCICLVNRWLPVRGRRAAPVDGACPNRAGVHIAHSVEQHAVNVSEPGSNPGVIPQGRTPPARLARTHPSTRACSAAGSAPHRQCGGRGFDPRRVHHLMTAYPNRTGIHA